MACRNRPSSSQAAFPRVAICVPSLEGHAAPRDAWLSISACIRWKYIVGDGNKEEPSRYSSFRGASRLALSRLPVGARWSDVVRAVRVIETESGAAVVVPGLLAAGKHRDRPVHVTFWMQDAAITSCFVACMCARIAPWCLLYERCKDVVLAAPETVPISKSDLLCPLFHTDSLLGDDLEEASRAGRPSWTDEYDDIDLPGVISVTKLVDSSTTLLQQAKTLNIYGKESTTAARDNRAVSVLRFMTLAFPLIHCLFKSASELRRGGRFLRRCRRKVDHLRRVVVKCMMSILEPNGLLDDLTIRDYFESQEALVDVLEDVEMQVLRKKMGQFWRRVDWMTLESTIDRFCECATSVSRSAYVAAHSGVSVPRCLSVRKRSHLALVLHTLVEGDVESGFGDERALVESMSFIRRLAHEVDQHLAISDTVFVLGEMYSSWGSYDAAEPLLQECLERRRILFGDGANHVTLVEAMCSLAELFKNRESRWEAIDLYRDVLCMRKLMYEEDHEDIAFTLHELAFLLEEEAEVDEAYVLLDICYDMRRRLHGIDSGVDDIDVVMTLRSLARLSCMRGELDLSETQYRTCLDLWEKIHGQGFDDLDVARTIFGLGDVLDGKCEFSEAEVMYRETVGMMRRLLGAGQDDYELAYGVQRLGIFLSNRGEDDEAEVLCRESLEMYRRLKGDDKNVPVTRSLCILADAVRKNGKLDEAEDLYRQCVEIERNILGEDGADLVGIMEKLGGFLLQKECYEEAESIYRERLDLVRAVNGGYTQKEIALAIWKVAHVVRERGKLDEAEQLYRECLEIDRRRDDYTDTACCLSTLAKVLEEKGSLDESEKLYRENFELIQRLCGETFTQQEVALAMWRLAGAVHKNSVIDSDGLVVARDQHKLDEAEVLYRDCLEMERELYRNGTEDVDMLPTMDALGEVLMEKDDYDDAREVIGEVLEAKRMRYGEGVDHLDVAWSLHELAVVYEQLGDSTQSEALFRESLAVKQRCYGEKEDHENISATMRCLAPIILKRGEFDEAERMFRDQFDMDQRLDSENFSYSRALGVLGCGLLEASELERSERIFNESLSTARKCCEVDADDVDVSYALFMLAKVLEKKGDRSRAEELYRESLEMDKRLYGEEDHANIVAGLYRVGMIMVSRGDYVGAEKVLRESFDMEQRLNGEDFNFSVALRELGCELLGASAFEDAERIFNESLCAARKLCGDDEVSEDIGIVFAWLAEVAEKKEEWSRAEELHRESLSVVRRLWGEEHTKVAEILRNLGSLMVRKGDVVAAVEMYREAIDMERRLFGEEYNYPQALIGLGSKLLEFSELEHSERVFNESLSTARKSCGGDADDGDVSHALFKLAEVAETKGDRSRAEELYRESLEMDKRLYGEDHAHIAEDLRKLGSLMVRRGDIVGAEKICRESFDMQRRLKGESFELPAALFKLGGELLDVYALKDAERLFQNCLDTERELRGDDVDSDLMSMALFSLGHVAEKRGAIHQAEQFYLESSNMDKRLHSEARYEVLRKLGRVQLAKNNVVEGEKLYRESFDIERKKNGDGFNLAAALIDFGHDLRGEYALSDAERVFRESMSVSVSSHGKDADNEDVASALMGLGTVMCGNGFFDLADEFMQRSYDIYQRIHAKERDNFDISYTLYWRGVVAKDKGMLVEAKQMLQESMDIDIRLIGEGTDDDTFPGTLCRMAQVAFLENNFEVAEKLLVDSLTMSRRLLGDDADNVWIAYALLELGHVYFKRNDLDQAEEYCKKSLSMSHRLLYPNVDCIGVARACHLLAKLQFKRGFVRNAISEANNCLDMLQRVYKANVKHPRILRIQNHIAEWSTEIS